VSTPVLYHLEISHYNEKVRWALDYKGVPHERRAPPPILHMFWALAMTRRPTFPVLRLNGRAIGDSTRIIAALERDYPEPPLYPADPEELRRALELEEFFDEELGPNIRRYLFNQALEELEPREFVEGAMGNYPGPFKTMMRATSPVAQRMLRVRYGISADSANAAQAKVGAAIDRVEQELGEHGYLVGDRFTVADLTAAALLFPLVRPPEAPYMFQFNGPVPEGFQRFRDGYAGRLGFRWVEDVYRRHRGISAAIPA
jgi:glutathione S-transferase